MILVSHVAPIFLNSRVRMNKIIVIGVGNPFRGDDGVGWAIIDALEGKVSKNVDLRKIRGELGDFLEYFENYPAVYLIDACVGDSPVGSWQRIDALRDPLGLERTQTSTHGFGISQAVSMAKALNQLPSKLIIYGINGDRYNLSNELSPPVEKAIEEVIPELLKELNFRSV